VVAERAARVAEAVAAAEVVAVVVAEAEAEAVVEAEEIRHEKAPGSPDGRRRPGEPPAPRRPAAVPASRRRARSLGRAGLAWQDEQRPSLEVAFRSSQSWAAVRKVPPPSVGRPRPRDCPARVRHARGTRRLKPWLRASGRAANFSPAQSEYCDRRGRQLRPRGPRRPRRPGSCPRPSRDKGRRPRTAASPHRYRPAGTGPRRSWPSS
jgi:hypothetical protein